MSTSAYFVERFGRQESTAQAHITKFHPGDDSMKHVNIYQKDWKSLGYHDNRMWRHLFLTIHDDQPNKWYKIKESRGDTFTSKTLRENVIKDFSFIIDDNNLKPSSKQI